jgi:hypothetical protein
MTCFASPAGVAAVLASMNAPVAWAIPNSINTANKASFTRNDISVSDLKERRNIGSKLRRCGARECEAAHTAAEKGAVPEGIACRASSKSAGAAAPTIESG